MLMTPKDIFAESTPPYLIVLGDGSWRVAREIVPHQDGVGFLEPFADDASQAMLSGVLPGSPWHVGDDVWELDYNAQIMTLDHPHYRKHPAWRLWLQWLSSHDQRERAVH
jgi:hypothetical protein